MSKYQFNCYALFMLFFLTRTVGAQADSEVATKYWVCQGGPGHSPGTQYTVIFEGATEEFPSNVTYAHEFCDYIPSAKSISKDGLMCDCNVAATKLLAERWLHNNLSDERQHFEQLHWAPRSGGKSGASAQ